MSSEFAVVDLFAGPGGLAEGFSSLRNKDGSRPFRIALSVEKERSAFETLRLRSFFRQFDGDAPSEYYHFVNGEMPEPDWEALFPEEWKLACREVLKLELGSADAVTVMDARLAQISRSHRGNTILIGGPPCQAYSLVGRARNKGTEGYEPAKDHRHFLYREYIRILEKLRPAAFVMENVKGLLSSSIDGQRIFDQVLDDLSNVGNGVYQLVPLAPRSNPSLLGRLVHPPAVDFVVRAEDHGIPQSRHRVFVVGLRADVAAGLQGDIGTSPLLPRSEIPVAVRDVLKGMPKLRSGLSNGDDSQDKWRSDVSRVMRDVARCQNDLSREEKKIFREFGESIAFAVARSSRRQQRGGGIYASPPASCPNDLRKWLYDPRLTQFANNETRGHMLSDLGRYFYAALYGRVMGISPKADEFPDGLAPEHRNWKTGKFADRFRVQLWNSSATTVTSHIASDDLSQFREQFAALRPHLLACNIPVWEIDEKKPRVLVVEDFSTKGLTGDPGSLDGGNFHNFWRRHGKSGKTGRAGGRWGLGKLVYSTSSDIRCFFGLTVQAEKTQPLLMGQAVLSNHEVRDKKYVAHGFWFGERNAAGMQMPITDLLFIEKFRKQVGVTRTTQSGLSIVIPFINDKITEDVIIRGVVSNYYFPILAGRLVVEVGSIVIDAKSFGSVAKKTLIGEKDNPDRYSFVEQVSARLSKQPAVQVKPGGSIKQLSADQFEEAQISEMKNRYGRGEMVHVRVPVRLRRKENGAAEQTSWIDLFLKPPPEASKPFVLFARGSITVPGEARYFNRANAYGAFVASHEDIVSFLGDAENPAHTTWSGTAEKLTANWRSPAQTLRFLRYALWDLYTIVSDQGDRRDKDALIDFFSLADPAKSDSPKAGKKLGVPPTLAPAEKAFRIHKRGVGGFQIAPGPGAVKWEFPKLVRVRVAYDVLGANPFSKHSPFDFDFTEDDLKVDATNISVQPKEPNILELLVASPDFLLEVSGFDANRDLVVDAKAKP